jgi:hypothetical protein
VAVLLMAGALLAFAQGAAPYSALLAIAVGAMGVASLRLEKRTMAHTREIDSSHVAVISHPGVVADMIRDAAGASR